MPPPNAKRAPGQALAQIFPTRLINTNRTADPRCVLACSVNSCPWATCPVPISMVGATVVATISYTVAVTS